MDTPLMYEGGWGKKLSFIFSISRYGIVDAIHRYTRKLPEVLRRRIPARETDVQAIVKRYDEMLCGQCLNRNILRNFTNANNDDFEVKLQNPLELSLHDFHQLGSTDVNISTITKRRRLLQRELDALLLLSDHEWKMEELQGRIRGSADWKAMRGEDGSRIDNRLYVIGSHKVDHTALIDNQEDQNKDTIKQLIRITSY